MLANVKNKEESEMVNNDVENLQNEMPQEIGINGEQDCRSSKLHIASSQNNENAFG